MLAKTTHIQLVSVYTNASVLISPVLLLKVWFETGSSCPLLRRGVKSRSYYLISRFNLDMVGEVVCTQLFDHLPILLHHHLSFHIIFCYFTNSAILSTLSSMDEIDLYSSLFLLDWGSISYKWVYYYFWPFWVIFKIVSSNAMHPHVLLIQGRGS